MGGGRYWGQRGSGRDLGEEGPPLRIRGQFRTPVCSSLGAFFCWRRWNFVPLPSDFSKKVHKNAVFDLSPPFFCWAEIAQKLGSKFFLHVEEGRVWPPPPRHGRVLTSGFSTLPPSPTPQPSTFFHQLHPIGFIFFHRQINHFPPVCIWLEFVEDWKKHMTATWCFGFVVYLAVLGVRCGPSMFKSETSTSDGITRTSSQADNQSWQSNSLDISQTTPFDDENVQILIFWVFRTKRKKLRWSHYKE